MNEITVRHVLPEDLDERFAVGTASPVNSGGTDKDDVSDEESRKNHKNSVTRCLSGERICTGCI